MSNPISDKCSVVALYGIDSSPNRIEQAFNHVIDWFVALGYPPQKLGIKAQGFSGKTTSFSNANRRLRTTGFSTVEGFGLYCLVPGGEVPLWDWCLTAEMSKEKSYFLIGARTSVAALSHMPSAKTPSIFQTGQSAIEVLEPNYGIGFVREMHLGPSLYAAGICQGIQPFGDMREEVSRINDWGRIGLKQRVYKCGLLRDVYPWNFLSDSQLGQKINGHSLKEWICQDSCRGILTNLTQSISFWEVEESQIPLIRAELQFSGIIFNARDAIEN